MRMTTIWLFGLDHAVCRQARCRLRRWWHFRLGYLRGCDREKKGRRVSRPSGTNLRVMGSIGD